MSQNAFSRILARLDESDGVSEKTASVDDAPDTEAVMLDTVRRISESNQKTASDDSAPTPAASLEALAQKTAAAEEENLIKTAQGMGAIICDSFFERFAAYDTALQGAGVKQAAAPAAGASQEQLKQAAQAGYQQATQDLEKQAQESFDKGYQDTLQAVYKSAAEIHYQGQLVANEILKEASQA